MSKVLNAKFQASCQHAAVNMPQEQIESYVPAFPLAMYKPPPVFEHYFICFLKFKSDNFKG